MNDLDSIRPELLSLVKAWEPKLRSLPQEVIAERRNRQDRTIKQIVGHMVDSASNNTHRVVHLQYQPSPLIFPCYASGGNNDRWIAIQNYQAEDWNDLVQLWKHSNLHFAHVIANLNVEKLENVWISGSGQEVSLRAMVIDYLPHFRLHLDEIDELMNQT